LQLQEGEFNTPSRLSPDSPLKRGESFSSMNAVLRTIMLPFQGEGFEVERTQPDAALGLGYDILAFQAA